jgi:site-specific recombinase XerD
VEPGPLFFPIRKGGRNVERRRMTAQTLRDMLLKRARQASVKNLTPHDLRRTFVGDMLDAGADISAVQQLAGHSSVDTTQRYDRRGEEVKRRAAGLLTVPYVRKA